MYFICLSESHKINIAVHLTNSSRPERSNGHHLEYDLCLCTRVQWFDKFIENNIHISNTNALSWRIKQQLSIHRSMHLSTPQIPVGRFAIIAANPLSVRVDRTLPIGVAGNQQEKSLEVTKNPASRYINCWHIHQATCHFSWMNGHESWRIYKNDYNRYTEYGRYHWNHYHRQMPHGCWFCHRQDASVNNPLPWAASSEPKTIKSKWW